MRLRFDHGPSGAASLFDGADRLITAHTPAEVPAAFLALDKARSEGRWVAGFASYELGFALEPRLLPAMPQNRRVPLLNFGVYDAPREAPELSAGSAHMDEFRPGWSATRYNRAFDGLHEFIKAGDIYQANLTLPVDIRTKGTPEALYRALCDHQPVRLGALITQEDGPAILSRSPELFFSTDMSGRIETRPMKGTQPRSPDPREDEDRRRFLASDEKNRAENLMIVDLLRNDISRICELGSVEVPRLFEVETYATVHQMTSLVSGRLRAGTRLSDIFRALFPCGSITGAPKLRAMQILAELEGQARDIYCGTIGWAAPDGRSEFNVAIRTLLHDGDQATLNVGGGVVYDSTAASEYEEALWKARFVHQLMPAFS
ncbi:MAG: aminodeoxychorismate synthase component I [Pseudomonadota bacterium]